MIPPYTGQLQIAETRHARALSIDGQHWEIQLRLGIGAPATQPGSEKEPGRYAAIGHVSPTGLIRHPLPAPLDTEAVRRTLDALYAWISQAPLPLPAMDRFEYWLLDRAERRPLALLDTCVTEDEIGEPWVRPRWTAMPASRLPVEDPCATGNRELRPVNARLESLIAKRAGPSPRAAWFDRRQAEASLFPPCLIREDWEREADRRLCQQYIHRLAPRLLMLQDLDRETRRRLEQASRKHALDVDRFHRLYPEFLDQSLLVALRVEARLRRAARPSA